MEEKKVSEWLQELPGDIRKLALLNFEANGFEDIYTASRGEAIIKAFSWVATKQKFFFWNLVCLGRYEEALNLLNGDFYSDISNDIKPNPEQPRWRISEYDSCLVVSENEKSIICRTEKEQDALRIVEAFNSLEQIEADKNSLTEDIKLLSHFHTGCNYFLRSTTNHLFYTPNFVYHS